MATMDAMKNPRQALVLACLMQFVGCGIGNVVSSVVAASNVSGNWQIQSAAGASTTATPTAGLLMIGALASSGTSVTGTFRLANLTLPNNCGTPLQQIVTVSGTIDALGNLNLTSAAFSGSVITIQLVVPAVATQFGAGTVAIAGGACTFASSPAIGAEFAPVTGTYSGAVAANTSFNTPPILAGTATMTLTQAATAGSDGSFPVGGSVSFSGGGCSSSTPVTGTVSGGEVMLASVPVTTLALPSTRVIAVVNPAGSQLYNASIGYALGPCGAGVLTYGTYTGNLLKQ